ncbi:sensor histidine kinase [Brevibacillus choshinensis]|uniref:sensor histidine kinase n=1 Tax=Brevibacillus choshinensis TaxID=54911 RepID=UPI002E222E94|nr:histidine kinase [Brevibacillus choshinensis]MED4586384.1 histidine kinase [Brevibacillus choshinensis]MED4754309.1 histidine kinase [Brevibacillus choshinensis]
MDWLLKEFRLVVYFFQWVLLLAFCFFYMDAPDSNSQSFIAFLLIVLAYVSILFYALPRKRWFLLGLVDMGLALFFIIQTGKWSSPFMLYAYTTLLWLMVVLRLEQVLLIVVLFILSASLLQEWMPFTMIPAEMNFNQLRLLLDITLWVSMAFCFFALLRSIKNMYSRCYRLFLFMKKVASSPTMNLCATTEQMVRRVFRSEQAYLCLYQNREAEGEWKREYFLNTLLDAGAEEWERVTVELLDDYSGQKDTYVCMPLRLEGEAWGCLIFSISPKRVINRGERLMLRMISLIICQQGKQTRARYELAKSLHEEMRRNLAQDMHDGLAQQLFFLSAQMFQLKRSLPQEVQNSAAQRLEQIEERIKWCHGEVRHTITHLREFRESEQLAEAIEQLLKRMTVGTDLQVRFTSKGRVLEEELPVLNAIYRMVEEATANTVKHARARNLTVSVEASSVQVKVRVNDDGIGFVAEEKTRESTYGVVGMRERIAQVGGTLHIRSKPSEGTEILAIIPRKGVEMYG